MVIINIMQPSDSFALVSHLQNEATQFTFQPFTYFQPFTKQQILDPSKLEELQKTIIDLMKMTENSPKGSKTLWEKEELLVMSNFSVFQCFQKTSPADP